MESVRLLLTVLSPLVDVLLMPPLTSVKVAPERVTTLVAVKARPLTLRLAASTGWKLRTGPKDAISVAVLLIGAMPPTQLPAVAKSEPVSAQVLVVAWTERACPSASAPAARR